MRWPSLLLGRQYPSSGTNLRECEDQSRFKVQGVPVFRFDRCEVFPRTHGVRIPQVEDQWSRHASGCVGVTAWGGCCSLDRRRTWGEFIRTIAWIMNNGARRFRYPTDLSTKRCHDVVQTSRCFGSSICGQGLGNPPPRNCKISLGSNTMQNCKRFDRKLASISNIELGRSGCGTGEEFQTATEARHNSTLDLIWRRKWYFLPKRL
jgi:hypothetical protein